MTGYSETWGDGVAADTDDSFGALLARLAVTPRPPGSSSADRAGLSVGAISSLERGSRHPRRLSVDRLAAALELRAAAYQRRRPAPQRALLEDGPAPTPIIGRRAELAELFVDLAGDGPAMLGYDGEAGIGKSRLLAEAVAIGTGAEARYSAASLGAAATRMRHWSRRWPTTSGAHRPRSCPRSYAAAPGWTRCFLSWPDRFGGSWGDSPGWPRKACRRLTVPDGG